MPAELCRVCAGDPLDERGDSPDRRLEREAEQVEPHLPGFAPDQVERLPEPGRARGEVFGQPARPLRLAFGRQRRQADQELEGGIRAQLDGERRTGGGGVVNPLSLISRIHSIIIGRY